MHTAADTSVMGEGLCIVLCILKLNRNSQKLMRGALLVILQESLKQDRRNHLRRFGFTVEQ